MARDSLADLYVKHVTDVESGRLSRSDVASRLLVWHAQKLGAALGRFKEWFARPPQA